MEEEDNVSLKAHFMIKPSQIGKLVGTFGPQQRLEAWLKVWARSAYSLIYSKYNSESLRTPQKRAVISEFQLDKDWEALEAQVDQGLVATHESLESLREAAFEVLFQRNERLLHRLSVDKNSLLLAPPGVDLVLDMLVGVPSAGHKRFFGILRACRDLATKVLAPNSPVWSLLNAMERLATCWNGLVNRAHCEHGHVNERRFIKEWEAVNDGDSKIEPAPPFRPFRLSPSQEGGEEDVCCVVDGRGSDGQQAGVMVEIKHRLGRLPKYPPLGELIQMHACMVSCQQRVSLLFEGVSHENMCLVRQREVFFSDALWREVEAHLHRCLEFILMLCTRDKRNATPTADLFFRLGLSEQVEFMTSNVGDPLQVPDELWPEFFRPPPPSPLQYSPSLD